MAVLATVRHAPDAKPGDRPELIYQAPVAILASVIPIDHELIAVIQVDRVTDKAWAHTILSLAEAEALVSMLSVVVAAAKDAIAPAQPTSTGKVH